MEQGIRCNNHPDRNAIRLCDSCGMPFCTECLRKNLLGFYYCQRCHPRLFKNTPIPEYEIPRDEKGLRRIQKQVESSIKDESAHEPYKISMDLIGFTIGWVIFLFIYSIFTQLLSGDGVSFKWIILVATITYFSAGLCCGKFWPENPRGWGFWLTIPYIVPIALMLLTIISVPSSEAAGWAFVFLLTSMFFCLVAFLISSIGAYVGVRIGARLHPRDEKGLRRIQKQVDLSFILNSTYESIKTGITKRFIIGIIIGFCLFLLNYIIVNQLVFSFKWIILVATTTYFLAGLCCGKFLPENPRRWGFRLTIPFGFSVILLIISWFEGRVGGGGANDSIALAVFLLIFIFLCLALVLISSAGAYVGVRIGVRLPPPLDKSQDNE